MLLDLRGFRGAVERVERRVPADALTLQGEDVRLAGPVELEADVRKDQEKVRLVGRLQTTLELDCSRCLEAYQVPLDTRFDVLFLPATANTGAADQEMGEDDVGVSYYKDDVIDLAEVMREQVYLAMPMKPLCRDDCRGLCPLCGINRNRDTCDCQPAWVDPRLEPLRALKKT
jgi:uncharacterized protein